MTGDQVNVEMIGLRQRLAALLERYAAGERSSMCMDVRSLTDEVVCLLDEAPERKRGVINRLADRCEALARQVTN